MPLFVVKRKVVMHGTPGECFAVLKEVKNWYLWNANILHSSLDGPMTEGAKGMVAPALHSVSPIRISKCRENTELEVECFFSLGKVITNYKLEPHQETQTLFHYTFKMESPIAWFLYLFAGRSYRQKLTRTLIQFDERVQERLRMRA